jgi:CheY-like chemotaxis protein
MGLFGSKAPEAPVAALKPRLLLCEDDTFFSQTLTLILSTAGYEVIVAADGQIGVNTLAQDANFKVVLCDIKMPNLDGFGVLKFIKATPALSQIPFVFLTGVSDMESMERATELGAKDYFIKATTGLPKIVDLVKKYA